jgi:hypothetical protein
MTATEIGCLLRCDRPRRRRLHRGGNNFEGKWSNEPHQAAAGLAAQLSGGEASARWRRELMVPALRVAVPSAEFEKSIVASLSSLGEFTEATSSCAAEACDQEQLCQIADAAIDQINKGSELRLGTLISAAMLNPCLGRHFIARSAVR